MNQTDSNSQSELKKTPLLPIEGEVYSAPDIEIHDIEVKTNFATSMPFPGEEW